MGKTRLEAFSDGVIAVIITIMVLELKPPKGAAFETLLPLWPVFTSYVLSFVYIGVYWTNHHHLIQPVKQISGGILWANLNLLFWLSLIPFTTAWMAENHFQKWPTTAYGIVLLFSSVSYEILVRSLIAERCMNIELAKALGRNRKGRASCLLHFFGALVSFFYSWAGLLIYMVMALIWILPDRRIENKVNRRQVM